MREKTPLVSVAVPCFNHEKYIEECILSIISQAYKNIEIIVIDDGSKDNSSLILEKLSNEYGFYFERQENQGISKTLNKCLSYAKSDLIVTISSDDVLMPNAISDFVAKFFEIGEQFSLIFGDSFLINQDSKHICVDQFRNIAKSDNLMAFSTFIDFFRYHRKDLLNLKYIGSYASLIKGNYLPVGMMFNKKTLLSVGAWNENLMLEDHDLWLRMSKVHKFEYTNTIVSKYRLHESNTLKKYKHILIKNAIKTLINEKKFIQQYGVKKEWQQAYNENLWTLLRDKEFSFFAKHYDIESSFLYFTIIKVFKKVLRCYE